MQCMYDRLRIIYFSCLSYLPPLFVFSLPQDDDVFTLAESGDEGTRVYPLKAPSESVKQQVGRQEESRNVGVSSYVCVPICMCMHAFSLCSYIHT